MNNYLKQYIRDNIQLADSYEYELLYVNLKSKHLRGELLTEFLLEVEFRGTKDQWKDLTSESMKYCTYTCSCTDGVVKKSR